MQADDGITLGKENYYDGVERRLDVEVFWNESHLNYSSSYYYYYYYYLNYSNNCKTKDKMKKGRIVLEAL